MMTSPHYKGLVEADVVLSVVVSSERDAGGVEAVRDNACSNATLCKPDPVLFRL